MAKKPKPNEPLVEVKIYVEKSAIDACGGMEKAKIIAYWSLVDQVPELSKKRVK